MISLIACKLIISYILFKIATFPYLYASRNVFLFFIFRKLISPFLCAGIIRKTRTVMECLHRFCRECIDKSMRLGYQNLVSLNDSSPLMSL